MLNPDDWTPIQAIFAALPDDEQAALRDALEARDLDAGAHVLTQGARADGLYVLLSGACAVVASSDDGASRELAQLGPGNLVGELSLLTERPCMASVVALGPARVARLTRAALQRLADACPGFTRRLCALSAERAGGEAAAQITQGPLFQSVILSQPLFADLDTREQRRILQHMRIEHVAGGAHLIRAGTPPDGLRVVLSGRCVVRTSRDGEHDIALGPGSVLGEMSLLARRPRTADVVVKRDAVVAHLDLDAFDVLRPDCPGLLAKLGEIAALRAMGYADSATPETEAIAVVGLGDVDTEAFAAWLGDVASAYGPSTVLTQDDHGNDPSTWVFNQAALAYRTVVCAVVPSRASDWLERCLSQCDRVVYVAHAAHAPAKRTFEPSVEASGLPTSLVLLQRPGATVGRGTAAWLDPRPKLEGHYHVRAGRSDDLARALRLMHGRGVGLVFAGASSRGVGHTGVVQAFRALGVPIDAVVGTSSGALAAASVGLDLSTEALTEAYLKLMRVLKPGLHNVTFPWTSLMDGHQVDALLQDALGPHDVEDALIPTRLMVTDLAYSEQLALDRGPVWRAVRASGSLPGYWPPVVLEDRVLVDGGVLDNMSVHVLDPLCGEGMVVVSDFGRSSERNGRMSDIERYGTSLSGWHVLARKLLGSQARWPSLMDVLQYAIAISSYKSQDNLYAAHTPDARVLLQPPAGDFGFFDVTPDQAQALIDRCADYTRANLPARWATRQDAVLGAHRRRA